MKRIAAALLGAFMFAETSVGGDIGFIEDFALAKDRSIPLKQLIPGTEDFYYYNALNDLNTEQYDKAEAVFKPWLERYGQTQRLTEIQTRHALLTYERDPKKTVAYLRNRMGIVYNHERVIPGGIPDLPIRLDQKLIARETLKAGSFGRWSNLDNFENGALDWVASENLNAERRRHLISRLRRPDIQNLPKLIADDLASPNSGGFGSYPVHGMLTPSQLDDLLKLRPELQNQANYVNTRLAKLHPGADENWLRNEATRGAYLDRIIAYTRTLNATHNSLKAHAIYHRLLLNRTMGKFDKALFIEYLKLPRQQGYMAKVMLESEVLNRYPANLGIDFSPVTLLPGIGGDELLVRSYLKHFFAEADSPREFEPYINDVYLKHLFAETKIELGLGEPERWASDLPPELFRQIKDRIDIDFAPTNKTQFGVNEPVVLDLFVKNVPSLLVKVFEINAANFYRETGREVDTDIMLDGLVANSEKVMTYTETPFRRMGRKFEFPELTKPGIYVVDFIGGGKSSRALIRKGRLRPIVTTTSAGQDIVVVDETNTHVKTATVWLGGKEYKADKDGIIAIPYSTQPGSRTVVITNGGLASLDTINHQGENIALTTGIHVDRESLLAFRVAKVIVRTGLTINGQPVSLKLLQETRLRLIATDSDGIQTTTEVPDFPVFEDRESVHEFRVPPRMVSLNVTMTGKVTSAVSGTKINVQGTDSFTLNQISATDKIEDLYFAKFGNEFAIELLGRTGEPKADRPVNFRFKHKDFKEQINVTLKTDAKGRISLGELADITNVFAQGPEGTSHSWAIPQDRATFRQVLHAKVGDTVTLPYLGTAQEPSRAEIAFFEMVGNTILADRFDLVNVKDGQYSFKDLKAGDYEVWLKKSDEKVRIRVVNGQVVGGYVLGESRHMELARLKPTTLVSVIVDGDIVKVKMKDASKVSRLHIFATRYMPSYDAYKNLAEVTDRELGGMYPGHAESVYLTGRNIGDEYRYVLDRRNQTKYPGNMLERPQMLLNPWAIRVTETGEQMAQGGEFFGRGGRATGAMPAAPLPPKPAGMDSTLMGENRVYTSNLDFLADASAVIVNAVPDDNGEFKFAKKDVGPHAMLFVVAVDPLSTTIRSVSLPEQAANVLDLRLRNGLDPKGHFTQQKLVTVLPTGQAYTVVDAAGSRFETYDSIGKLFNLYSTLNKDTRLKEFSFVPTWPKLKEDEKKALYSKYACHELSFFVFMKDPEFFKAVVKPYLANKKDKTFMDHWLLENELKDYLDPWKYSRLNVVERVLLARRVGNEAAATARHLAEILKLLPPNPNMEQMLFETGIKGNEMDKAGNVELRAKQNDFAFKALNAAEKSSASEMPPGMAPSPAPGGPGGGGGGFSGGGMGARPGSGGPPGKPESKKMEEESLGKMKDGRADSERRKELRDAKNQPMEQAENKLMEKGEGKDFFEDARALDRAKQVTALYRKIEPTSEWAENNYYHRLINEQLAELVSVSAFWADYAKHQNGPFLSKYIAEPARNFTEIMLALAITDLPFEAKKAEVKFDGGTMTYTPAGPTVAFVEQVRPVGAPAGQLPILVSQNIFKANDRYKDENGERLDKFVQGEFIAQTVYGIQVVVTNPSPSRQRLSVLVQVPVGAIPVANAQPTKTIRLDLEPYRTQTLDVLFYFPLPGTFAQFPVHVAKNEITVAAAAPVTFTVVAKPTKADTESWDYISQSGTTEQLLAYMERENVHALNLDRIAWRMKDVKAFETVTALLKARHQYSNTLWSYALLHNNVPAAREFLAHSDLLVNEVGGPITSPLFVLNPIERHLYEHLEYKPLVNARAHSLGQRRQIVNDRFYQRYHAYLKTLSYRKALTEDDKLALVYDLLLQDRVGEAQATFATVDAGKVATKMQYDYCQAYLMMFDDEPGKARAIAMKYANYPVDKWKAAFASVINVLDEAEGKGPKVADVENRDQRQGQIAANEPGFEFTVDNKTLKLNWQNMQEVTVNYYLMDVELLFSRNPFVQQTSGQFNTIKPNKTAVVKLAAGQTKMDIPLPEDLVKRNVLVEITGAGKTRTNPYYANAMTVRYTETYGQVTVTNPANNKPLAKVYVKTYVKLQDGTVKFHKDGYTDIRGRFDYATVSTPERSQPARFSVLVLSEEFGAAIKEVEPPQR